MAYRHPRSFYRTASVLCIGFCLFLFKAPSLIFPSQGNASPALTPEDAIQVLSVNGEGSQLYHGRHLLQDETFQCKDVLTQPNSSEKCHVATEACSNEGFFQYYDFVYCLVGIVPLAMAVLILWWLFLFVGLAVCADDFFCPSLVVISKTLHLSPNVAGVTFLAFGNGAPDFFSAISALSSTESEGELGIGGLFGAGMFVTSVVVGAIGVVKPFKAMARPFLRDIIFYTVAVYWAFLMMWREKVYLFETIGYVVLYVIYVVVVILSGKIYSTQKAKADTGGANGVAPAFRHSAEAGGVTLTRLTSAVEPHGLDIKPKVNFSFDLTGTSFGKENPAYENDPIDEQDDSHLDIRPRTYTSERRISMDLTPQQRERVATMSDVFMSNGGENLSENGDANGGLSPDTPNGDGKHVMFQNSRIELMPDTVLSKEEEAAQDGEGEDLPMWKVFLYGINPINTEEWSDMPVYSKGYELFKSPIMFLILLTCPVINYDDEELNNWNRPLNVLQCFWSPTVSALLVQVAFIKLGDVFPVYGITLILGVVFAAVVFFTSKTFVKPKYHSAFGYFGFLVALVWIYTLANEIVSLLETFGLVFGISEAILGLTLLAWGNSIGDLISNTVMARQGFARMGFAACYGAPFFNLTLGFGLAMTMKIVALGTSSAPLPLTRIGIILALFLGLSLLSSIVALPLLLGFKIARPYGLYLLCLYLVFMVVALLTETEVIPSFV